MAKWLPWLPGSASRRPRRRPAVAGGTAPRGAAAVTLMALVASVVAIAPAAAVAEPQLPAPSAAPLFVPDVVAQFDGFSRRADGLGFDLAGAPDSRACKHYQGVARVHGPDGTPYLLVSQNRNHHATCPTLDDEPGVLLIVRLESRNRGGERLRSNRLARDWHVRPPSGEAEPTFWPTPPDPRDRVVRTITFDGTDGWPAYYHPGGVQVVGDVLALALEAPVVGSGYPLSRILFLDVANPESPQVLSWFDPPDPGGGDTDFTAGLAGITPVRTPDGACCRYLMVVTGGKNIDVRFYLSLPTDGTTTDLTAPGLDWERVGHFSDHEIEACLGADWHDGTGDAHQMLNFVRQGGVGGPLFMIGARNDTAFLPAADYVDLYQVHVAADGTLAQCPLTHVSSRQLTSFPYMGGGDSANFAAAAGIYVSPSGELVLYATEYENDGPFRQNADGTQGDRRTVRFGEWRHFDVVRPGSATLRPTVAIDGPFVVDEGSSVQLSGAGAQPLTKAWIQLYEDDGAGNSVPGDGDRWLVVDYPDRDADDFDDFGELAFFNEAGSWRWFAPRGCTIFANDHAVDDDPDPGPDTVLLVGDGNVYVERDLDALRVVDPQDARISPAPDGSPVVNYDDDVGSVTFGSDCDEYYGAAIDVAWDLDADGSFETSGTSVTLDATLLDGPTSRTIAARGQHPHDATTLGRGVPVDALVTVRNVAPAVASAHLFDGLGRDVGEGASFVVAGLPVAVDVSFTDAGVRDEQTARVDWGDGTVDTSFDAFSDAQGGALGLLNHTHAYAEPGRFTVTITLTDDDGAATAVEISVEVLSPAQGLETVVGLIDTLIATATNPEVVSALHKARDHLAGNLHGHASNGAVDKLAADDPVSAITKIGQAIARIVEAEAAGGGDLTALKDTLAMIASAIAVSEHAAAAAAVSSPSPREQQELDVIAGIIDDGDTESAAGDHATACRRYREATERARRLRDL